MKGEKRENNKSNKWRILEMGKEDKNKERKKLDGNHGGIKIKG